jgi:hypothetical protein
VTWTKSGTLSRDPDLLSSVQDQDDPTVTLAPQHMEKVHKDDSSEYMVEKVPCYKLKMVVRTVKKRKYEVLGETGEIDEVPADRDTIMAPPTGIPPW